MFERCFNSITGLTAPTMGVVISFQSTLDSWFRTASLAVGLLVGLLSLYNIVKKIANENSNPNP